MCLSNWLKKLFKLNENLMSEIKEEKHTISEDPITESDGIAEKTVEDCDFCNLGASVETVESTVEETDVEVKTETIEGEPIIDETVEIADDNADVEFLKNFDWESISDEDIDKLNTIDLDKYLPLVNWYMISKVIDLPDDFLIKNRHNIDWKVYNKRYLSKKVKTLLLDEGYLPIK